MTASPDVGTPELVGEPRSRYRIDCAGAQLHIHARSSVTVLRVAGEVDASNAELLTQAIGRFLRLRAVLVVDLSGLEFLGSAGFEALLVLNEQAQTHCSVVNGPALRRLTQVLPGHGLPVFESLPEAAAHLDSAVPAPRRLMPGLARQPEPERAATG